MKKVRADEMRYKIQDAFVDFWIAIGDEIDADRSLDEVDEDFWMPEEVESEVTERILKYLEANDLLITEDLK